MLSPTAVKSMFEALPLHEPFWPAQRTSGAVWQETDLTRFMLYTLKCSSTHVTMDEIDAESAETRPGMSGASIDTAGAVEGRRDISGVDVEERRRMSEVACEMVRKAAGGNRHTLSLLLLLLLLLLLHQCTQSRFVPRRGFLWP